MCSNTAIQEIQKQIKDKEACINSVNLRRNIISAYDIESGGSYEEDGSKYEHTDFEEYHEAYYSE